MKKHFLLALGLLLILSFNVDARKARKTVAILGDSYSTFESFIPQGNPSWYFKVADTARTDVNDVRQTWWWQTVSKGGYRLGAVESYSGSTVSNRGYDGADFSSISFLARASRLGNPDIILICGGTNDSWAGVPAGEYKYEDMTAEDLYTYRPALARLFQIIGDRYPNVEVYFILNDGLGEGVVESTLAICRHYGIPCIELKDIEKKAGHPDRRGMESISEQVLNVIGKNR